MRLALAKDAFEMRRILYEQENTTIFSGDTLKNNRSVQIILNFWLFSINKFHLTGIVLRVIMYS